MLACFPSSASPQRILRLAASIATGIPVSLSDILTGIGRRNGLLKVSACVSEIFSIVEDGFLQGLHAAARNGEFPEGLDLASRAIMLTMLLEGLLPGASGGVGTTSSYGTVLHCNVSTCSHQVTRPVDGAVA